MPKDMPDPPEIPAGTVRLLACVRCGRELGWSPGKVPPGARIGGSKFSSPFERYCCAECLSQAREYWR